VGKSGEAHVSETGGGQWGRSSAGRTLSHCSEKRKEKKGGGARANAQRSTEKEKICRAFTQASSRRYQGEKNKTTGPGLRGGGVITVGNHRTIQYEKAGRKLRKGAATIFCFLAKKGIDFYTGIRKGYPSLGYTR